MSWDDESAIRIERETEGHRAVQGLDVSFQVLGHVIRDGEVVGIMTEHSYGRLVEFCDRSVVYEAFGRLQRNGILYQAAHESTIIIADGKVRLLGLSTVIKYRRDERELLAERARVCYWELLDMIFGRLEGSNNFYPLARSRHSARIIPRLPSPQRPLAPNGYDKLIRFLSFAEDSTRDEFDDTPMSRSRECNSENPSALPFGPAHSTSSSASELLRCAMDDPSNALLLCSSRRNVQLRRLARHPYHRSLSSRISLRSANSDKTSDSEMNSLL